MSISCAIAGLLLLEARHKSIGSVFDELSRTAKRAECPVSMQAHIPVSENTRCSANPPCFRILDAGAACSCALNVDSKGPVEAPHLLIYIPVGERISHFLAVTGDTPAAAAALAGVYPSNVILTLRSRSSGISLAFLCRFI